MSCNNKTFASLRIKRATNAEFSASNIILASGEPAYAIDTRVLKIGDGTTIWSQLLPINVSGTLSFPSLIGSNNINISTTEDSYIISTFGLANENHQHLLVDITDFNPNAFAPSGNYAPSGHQHLLSDITNFNPNVFAPSGHQHVLADITDFNASGADVYSTSIHDLGNINDDPLITIDWDANKQIQTAALDASILGAFIMYKGSNWPSTSNISRDVLLKLSVDYVEAPITWDLLVNNWYNIPPDPLPVAKHLILLRAMGTSIEGHYLCSGVF